MGKDMRRITFTPGIEGIESQINIARTSEGKILPSARHWQINHARSFAPLVSSLRLCVNRTAFLAKAERQYLRREGLFKFQNTLSVMLDDIIKREPRLRFSFKISCNDNGQGVKRAWLYVST
jgi:hypothetical protein